MQAEDAAVILLLVHSKAQHFTHCQSAQNIRRKQAAQRKRIRQKKDETAARQGARTAEEQVQHELFGEDADAGEICIPWQCAYQRCCRMHKHMHNRAIMPGQASGLPEHAASTQSIGRPCMQTPCYSSPPCCQCKSASCYACSLCHAGLEDEPEDTVPAPQERQMRYDDDGLDSEDDFIDDDIGDGVQGQQPRRARNKSRTDGVHSQAVQVS